jgi:hypothetical protein
MTCARLSYFDQQQRNCERQLVLTLMFFATKRAQPVLKFDTKRVSRSFEILPQSAHLLTSLSSQLSICSILITMPKKEKPVNRSSSFLAPVHRPLQKPLALELFLDAIIAMRMLE